MQTIERFEVFVRRLTFLERREHRVDAVTVGRDIVSDIAPGGSRRGGGRSSSTSREPSAPLERRRSQRETSNGSCRGGPRTNVVRSACSSTEHVSRRSSCIGTSFIQSSQLALHFGWVESELGKSTWLAGDELTAADMQMLFTIEAAVARGSLGDQPNLKRCLAQAHGRPAYQRGEARAGKLTLL